MFTMRGVALCWLCLYQQALSLRVSNTDAGYAEVGILNITYLGDISDDVSLVQFGRVNLVSRTRTPIRRWKHYVRLVSVAREKVRLVSVAPKRVVLLPKMKTKPEQAI